jgi:hypothetical protein
MAKRKTLNEKRLTKKEVQELIPKGSLHKEYTAEFREELKTGTVEPYLIYELPSDRFLLVFNEGPIRGKGDLYDRNYFERFVRWNKRVNEDAANGRGNSGSHWWFYSKRRETFVDSVPRLLVELPELLGVDATALDLSYPSLDKVSSACERLGMDKVMNSCYDHLVAYVGEIIRQRINGLWAMRTEHTEHPYPFVGIGLPNVEYMPINVVWGNLNDLDQMDLRKGTGDEVRVKAFDAQFARRKAGQIKRT